MSKQSELVKLLQKDGALSVPTGTTAQRPSSPAAGDLRQNSDNNDLETYNGSSWQAVGDQTRAYAIQYLVIGGGAGGAGSNGRGSGGGGAGGYRSSVPLETSGGGASAESELNIFAGSTYTVTVGAGGAKGIGGAGYSTGEAGTNGGNSVFGSITSLGGGGGGAAAGLSGGSGGGGAGGDGGNPANTGGAGTSGQG